MLWELRKSPLVLHLITVSLELDHYDQSETQLNEWRSYPVLSDLLSLRSEESWGFSGITPHF